MGSAISVLTSSTGESDACLEFENHRARKLFMQYLPSACFCNWTIWDLPVGKCFPLCSSLLTPARYTCGPRWTHSEVLLPLRRVCRTPDRLGSLPCSIFLSVPAGLVTHVSFILTQVLLGFREKSSLIVLCASRFHEWVSIAKPWKSVLLRMEGQGTCNFASAHFLTICQVRSHPTYSLLMIPLYLWDKGHTLFFFLAPPHCMWDLSSLSRDWTCTPFSGSTDPEGNLLCLARSMWKELTKFLTESEYHLICS